MKQFHEITGLYSSKEATVRILHGITDWFKIGRKWQPIPVFLPGKSHGRGSLVGHSSWGYKESDMTEWLFSLSLKIGKGVWQCCMLSPCLFYLYTEYILRNAGWMNHRLESRFLEKYQQSQIHKWYHFNGRKLRETKEPLNEDERREWKSWLKTQHSKNEDHGIWSPHFMANGWEKKVEAVTDFIFLGSKITLDSDYNH